MEIISGTENTGQKTENIKRAFDNDLSSMFHGSCVWNTDVWLRLQLSSVRCIRKVIIFQTHLVSVYKMRMDYTNVTLINTLNETSTLCGILLNPTTLNSTDSYHYTDCGNNCGDVVELRVNHEKDNSAYHGYLSGCIHVFDVSVYMECPLGYYRNSEGQCEHCPRGTYNSMGGSVCVFCPDGSQPNLARTACGESLSPNKSISLY